jgi:hypothetical protein
LLLEQALVSNTSVADSAATAPAMRPIQRPTTGPRIS